MVFAGNHVNCFVRDGISNDVGMSRLSAKCHFLGPHMYELFHHLPPSNEHMLYISNEGLETAHAAQILCKQVVRSKNWHGLKSVEELNIGFTN